jgi:DNA-binding PadR family transcriptional regulator
MATLRQDDQLSLTLLDLRILSALAIDQMNGYQVRRQIRQDGDPTVSTGATQYALKSLTSLTLIREINQSTQSRRRARVYQISPLGKTVLAHNLKNLRQLVRLGTERLK